MDGMRYRGYLLLLAGFVAGTFVACLDTDVINWRLFVPSLVIAALGMQQIRTANRGSPRSEKRLRADCRELEASLEAIVKTLSVLRRTADEQSAFEMRHEIDRRLRDDIDHFVEARDTLARLYGLQAYADIVSEFAAGERYLNRVWSASADGYLDEVVTYLDRAQVQFEHAHRRLQAVQAH